MSAWTRRVSVISSKTDLSDCKSSRMAPALNSFSQHLRETYRGRWGRALPGRHSQPWTGRKCLGHSQTLTEPGFVSVREMSQSTADRAHQDSASEASTGSSIYIDRWHRWQSLSCVCGCGWQQNSLFFTVCMWRLILSFSCRNCLLFLILGGVPAHILSWTSYFCSDKKFPNKHYCALQIPKPALNQLLVESYMLTLGKDLAITCSDVSPK